MGDDRRREARAHVLRRGRIVFRRGYSAIDCVVLDLSAGGARLKLGGWLGLPETFELRLDYGPVHEVRVRYRGLDATGVQFVDRQAA